VTGGARARSGFDFRPARPAVATALLVAAVVVASAGFARLFREVAGRVVGWYGASRDPTETADRLAPIAVFALVTSSVFVAAVVGREVQRRWGDRVGIEVVAASARGEARPISLRASLLRAAATWTMSAGLTSVGREAAIVESGGALGSVSGRRSGGRGEAMAVAGIAAAFAGAYHAPVAALFYVEEHLKVGHSTRAVTFAVAGAGGGYVASAVLFGGNPVFPSIQGGRWQMVVPAMVGVIPAVVATRAFLQLRVRVTSTRLARTLGWRQRFVVAGLSALAGLAVTVFPAAAGNGMESLRHSAVSATVTVALALSLGKLIGTAATLAAGAPGGALTPSMCVAAGTALLTLLGWHALGLPLDHPWDAVVATMAIGVAVGMRSPLTAIFIVPELLGDYRLLPVIALIVGLAVVVDRGLDLVVVRIGRPIPTGVYDEDA
jgi:CIC family chloride channel protein